MRRKFFKGSLPFRGEVIDGAKAPEKWTKWAIPERGLNYFEIGTVDEEERRKN